MEKWKEGQFTAESVTGKGPVDPLVIKTLRRAEHWEYVCDDCNYQEDRHYCLLHSVQVKNMDIMRCDDFMYFL